MKRRAGFTSIAGTLLMFSTTVARADLESDLNTFVDQLGGSASLTSPTAFEGQGYRYLNGGQVFVRVPNQ